MPDVLGFLRKAAPWVATAVSSIAPGPIGIVAGVIAKKLGGEAQVKPTADSVVAAITPLMTTDEGRAKLAEIEAETQKAFNDLNIKQLDDFVELEKVYAGDRDSARNRQIQLKDRIPSVLAILVTVGFFGLLALMFKFSPPASNRDLLNIMLGSLGTAWIAIITFYFGSSKGSDDKNQIITNLSK